MSDQPGAIGWHDLTVPNADAVRDFYQHVVGWSSQPVEMGGYSDFNMLAEGECVAGICYQRGVNEDLPAQWLMYVPVKDLTASMATCRDLGGEVIAGPRTLGDGRFCVIRDPAGAVCALWEPG